MRERNHHGNLPGTIFFFVCVCMCVCVLGDNRANNCVRCAYPMPVRPHGERQPRPAMPSAAAPSAVFAVSPCPHTSSASSSSTSSVVVVVVVVSFENVFLYPRHRRLSSPCACVCDALRCDACVRDDDASLLHALACCETRIQRQRAGTHKNTPIREWFFGRDLGVGGGRKRRRNIFVRVCASYEHGDNNFACALNKATHFGRSSLCARCVLCVCDSSGVGNFLPRLECGTS